MMWIVLFISSFFELGFTVCLKLSEGFRKKKWTVLCTCSTICSIGLLSIATTELPLSVAYAVWTAVFKESKNPLKLFFLALVLLGVIGLRLSGVAH